MTTEKLEEHAESLQEDILGRQIRDDAAQKLFGTDSPGTKLGRFEIVRRLGAGGQGSVFVVIDPNLGREVALKRLHARDAKHAARLRAEALALASISHDSVVQIHEVVDDEDQGPFIVMELVKGKPLDDWSRRGRSWTEVVRAFIALGRGLDELHRAGLVHRDVKPDNVLITEDGRVKLIDLGIAVTSRTVGETSGVTTEQQHAPAGTIGYMAPEQLGGQPDARSDQYSFCVALYRSIYGRLPKDLGYPAELQRRRRWFRRVSNQRPDPVVSGRIPAALDRVLGIGLRLDPENRFESMGTLCDALEHILWWRRPVVPLVTASAVVTATMAAALVLQPDERPACAHTEPARDLWAEPVQQRVREGFIATNLPGASSSFEAIDATLVGYLATLDTLYGSTCETMTNHDGETDSRVLERMACLERARESLTHTIEGLQSSAPFEVVTLPLRLELPMLDQCTQPTTEPEACDSSQTHLGQEEALRVHRKLEGARTRMLLGRYDDGLALVDQALAVEAPEPVHARAWLVRGRVAYEGQRWTEATEALRQAQSLADRHACDGLTVDALALLTKIEALHPSGSAKDAEQLSQQAMDRVEGLGDRGRRRADVLNSRGLILHKRLHRYADADALYQEAATLRETLGPGSALELSNTLLNRGSVLGRLGKPREAIDVLERSLEAKRDVLGEDHLELYKVYVTLSHRHAELGDLTTAHEELGRALTLVERGLGPSSEKAGELTLYQARLLEPQGRYDEARLNVQEAQRIYADLLPKEHPKWISIWGYRAQLELALSSPQEALIWATRAWELAAEIEGRPLVRAEAAYRLGMALAMGNAPNEALTRFSEAQEPFEEDDALQQDPLYAYLQLAWGEVLLDQGRPDAAEPLNRAVAWWTQHPNPDKLADAQWALARALCPNSDPERARELADAARRHFTVKHDDRATRLSHDISAWQRKTCPG